MRKFLPIDCDCCFSEVLVVLTVENIRYSAGYHMVIMPV